MNTSIERLDRLCDFYEQLQAKDVSRLSDFYTADVYFKDPFHEVNRLSEVQVIFEHMFKLDPDANFSMFDRFTRPQGAMVTWVLDMQVKNYALSIRGASHLEFNHQGLVTMHRDYWDTGEELFAKLPFVGTPTRWLLKQFSALKA